VAVDMVDVAMGLAIGLAWMYLGVVRIGGGVIFRQSGGGLSGM
jgi:hypothetical protein